MIQIEHSSIYRQQVLDSTFRKKVRQVNAAPHHSAAYRCAWAPTSGIHLPW